MRAVFAAVALAIAGQPAFVSAQTAADNPTIIVDGYGEARTAPDYARITYSLRGEGKTSEAAVKSMVASGAQIEAAIRSIDGGAEPLTSEVKVFAARGSECKDREYDNREQLSQGACAIVGYIATQAVSVRTTAVVDAGTLVGLIARSGGYNVGIEDFGLSNKQPAKQEALARALADAQVKAEAIAIGSKVRLGPVLSISTVGRPDGQDIVITGSRSAQGNLISTLPVTVVNLKAERITTSATVQVTYAILR